MASQKQDPHLSGQEFAESKVQELTGFGLRDQEAWRIVKIMGPGKAIACFQWIMALQQAIRDQNVLRNRLTRVARKTNRVKTAERLGLIFLENKLPAPAGGYIIMVRHLSVAQFLGLVPKKIALHVR